MMRTLVTLVLLIFITGCQQSPRKSFYLLSAAQAPSVQENATITQVIGLGPIELADYLQRSAIVRNRDANRVQLAEVDHWGEPLEKGIMRVLAINLMNKNRDRLIENFPWRSYAKPRYSLGLTIYDLQVIEGKAALNASWKLIDGENKTLISQQPFLRTKPCGESAAEIAKAYSELFADLAAEMDKAIVSANAR